MADLTDPRAVRSRGALLAVAAELLGDPWDGLSVTEVAARAGVSRPTFYQHFSDVPALMAAAVTAELEQAFTESDRMLAELEGDAFLRGTNRMLVDYVYARRESYRTILRGPASYEVLAAVIGYVSMRMRGNVLGAHLARRIGRIDADRITATAAGAVWLVTRWLDSDFEGQDTPGAFTERLTSIMLAAAGLPDTPAA